MARRILVADDEPHIRAILQTILQRSGYEVIAVENAEEAFRVATAQPVDAVVMDLNMPGLNGLDGIRSIKLVRADLPVIVLTGYSSDRICVEASEAGASACLFKPARAETICAELSALWDQVDSPEGEAE